MARVKGMQGIADEATDFIQETWVRAIEFLYSAAVEGYACDEFELVADAELAQYDDLDWNDMYDNTYVRTGDGASKCLNEYGVSDLVELINSIGFNG